MFGQLTPVGGGDPIPLLKPKLLVGRRSRCDILLDFPNVSSHHCELEFRAGYWHARNLSSSNGTKVNGTRIDEKYLQPGDTISFAKHAFEISYTPDPTAPPPQEEDPFSKSLLEKAGLSFGNDERPLRRPAPLPPAAKPLPTKPPGPKDEHDQALEWLLGDEPPA
jgi:hypothetical protein